MDGQIGWADGQIGDAGYGEHCEQLRSYNKSTDQWSLNISLIRTFCPNPSTIPTIYIKLDFSKKIWNLACIT